jgi:hypothetical protein
MENVAIFFTFAAPMQFLTELGNNKQSFLKQKSG